MIDIAKIIKKFPKGHKLYSPILGWVTIVQVQEEGDIMVCSEHNTFHYFTKYGQFNFNSTDLGECLLFPSKEGRSWEDYFTPHYNFKPFDKVVVRYDSTKEWIADMFSHIRSYPGDTSVYITLGGQIWKECLPYNEETAKLIGTTEDYAG